MNHLPPTAPAGPWCMLVLDRTAEDPHWVLTTVTLAEDIRPATLNCEGQFTDWPQVVAWVRERLGHDVALTPVTGVLAWTAGRPR